MGCCWVVTANFQTNATSRNVILANDCQKIVENNATRRNRLKLSENFTNAAMPKGTVNKHCLLAIFSLISDAYLRATRADQSESPLQPAAAGGLRGAELDELLKTRGGESFNNKFQWI